MAAFACLVTMYLYYKYVIHQHHQTKTNKAALVVGCVVCFGMVMVGAFQWTVVLVPHMIGAFLACGGATLYSWLIVHISRRQLAPKVHGMGVVYCRMVIALVESIAATVFLVALVLWKVNEKYRSFAAIAEWILIYGAILFLLTLVYDLRRIKDTSLDLILHSDYTVTSPVSAKEDDRLNEVSVT
ncbi:DNA damage-regulated autophagy modulator protein 1-like [Clavelina lepadiformis]|uniref:DNA damage-regulated autophagy modulator protein 1-like n=1 Tax=Clavelina lepadiformis TaxID=159417 RepID=UPI0040428F74